MNKIDEISDKIAPLEANSDRFQENLHQIMIELHKTNIKKRDEIPVWIGNVDNKYWSTRVKTELSSLLIRKQENGDFPIDSQSREEKQYKDAVYAFFKSNTK